MKKSEFINKINKEMLMDFSFTDKQKAVAVGVGAVLSIALIGGGVHASNQNKYSEVMQKQIETAKTEQVEYTVGNDVAGFNFDSIPYVKDGYDNLDGYWNDLVSMRSSAKGMANAAISSYGAYMTDEQEDMLRQYENSMISAATIDGFNSAMEKFDEIVDECRPVYTYSGGGSYYSSGGSGVLTRSGGVNYYNGRRETWYSQRVLPGGGLDIPGRHVNEEDGTVRDADGYICVAASDLAYGTVVETSLGTGKVYDTGCAAGTTDIYTDW